MSGYLNDCNGIQRHKVVLTGQYGVGKTSLFRCFVGDSLCERPTESHADTSNSSRQFFGQSVISQSANSGIDCYTRRLTAPDGRAIMIELHDTSGLERYRSLSSSYYTGTSAIIVCYSVSNKATLSTAAQYIIDAFDQVGRSTSPIGLSAPVFLCGINTSEIPQPMLDLTSNEVPNLIGSDDSDRLSKSNYCTASDVSRLTHEFDDVITRSYIVSCRSVKDVRDMFSDIAAKLATLSAQRADRRTETAVRLNAFGQYVGKVNSCNCI